MGSSKKQTVGYRYSLGLHMAIALEGDAVVEVLVGDRQAWAGYTAENTSVTINKPDLFGGDEKEGGVKGTLDFMMGRADQMPNAYLTAQQGGFQPGYRGFIGLVYSGQVSVNNPYIKNWAVRVRSIYQGWAQGACWYPEKAAVDSEPTAVESERTHVAVVKEGRDFRMYINGKLAGAKTLDFDIGGGSAGYFIVGRYRSTDPDYPYTGLIDNVRLTSAVRYAGNFTPSYEGATEDNDPLWAAVKINLRMEGAEGGTVFTDDKGHAFTAVGAAETTEIGALSGSSSGSFESAGYIRTPYAADLNLAGDWTLDLLFNAAAFPAPYSYLVSMFQVNGVHTGYTLSLNSSGTLRFGIDSNDYPDTPPSFLDPVTEVAGRMMNPAHMVYQALTDPDWGMGYPVGLIDDDNFRAAADLFFTEGLGLCTRWVNSTTVRQWTQLIADHGAFNYGQNRRTGKFEIIPLRQDYDVEDLDVYTKKEARVVKFQRPSIADTINEIIVEYTDVDTGKAAATPPLQNLANIQAQGRIVSQKLNFSMFPTNALAVRAAQRELQARSTPLWRFTLQFLRGKASSLQAGRPFVVDFLDVPGVAMKVVLRAVEINFGNSADALITAECVEDIFGMPAATYVAEPTPSPEPPAAWPRPADAMAFEIPYRDLAQGIDAEALAVLPVDAGYLGVVAAQPPGVSTNYDLLARLPPADYEEADVGDWAPYAETTAGIDKLETVIPYTGATSIDLLEVDTAVFIGADPATAEVLRIDGIDTLAGELTVGRGCGDTVPQEWPSGTPIWGYDNYSASGTEQYTDGETVNAKVLTNATAGTLPEADAPELSVEMASRAARPYPPGQFEIDGAAYPATAANPCVITWAHRDRVLQADQLIDQTDASIGPESTTRYHLRIYDDADVLIVERDDIAGETATVNLIDSGDVRIELGAISDNGASWQYHSHVLAYTGSGAVDEIVADTYEPPVEEIIIDGGGD